MWVFVESIVFLGHVISLEGLKVDSQKIEAIESLKCLKIVSKVWSFLGLAGYYNRFVEGFSKIALPLTELIKKVVRFEWIEECKKSFQELKCRITTARILALPTLEKEFEVLCDASHQGLGCILMQEWKVIA